MNEEFVLATADTPDSQAEAQKTEQPVERSDDTAPETVESPEASAPVESAPATEAPAAPDTAVAAEETATPEAAAEPAAAYPLIK